MRGYGNVGYIVGAGYGGVAEVQPVDPNLLAKNLPANDKAVQAMSEASKKPAELPKGKASWWKRFGAKVKGVYDGAVNKVKNVATGAVNTVGSFIGKTAWSPMQLVQAYNAYKTLKKPGKE